MGKKGKGGGGNLGKSLIRDRFGSTKIKRNNESMVKQIVITFSFKYPFDKCRRVGINSTDVS